MKDSTGGGLHRHYEQVFPSVSAEWRHLGAVDKGHNIISLSGNNKFSNVIDIGAGCGAVIEQLDYHRFADQYTACEIFDSAIDAIKDRNIARLKEVVVFDGYSLPFDDGSFDLAILSHVIEHVEHPRLLLREVARIVNPEGGAIFIEVPTELTIRLGRNYKWTDTGHINTYNPLTIRHLLQSTHLDIESEQLTNSSYPVHRFTHGKLQGRIRCSIRSIALRAVPVLASKVFTYHWAALCRRA